MQTILVLLLQMSYLKLKENIRNVDTLIMAAAVSDFTINKLDGKVKR